MIGQIDEIYMYMKKVIKLNTIFELFLWARVYILF